MGRACVGDSVAISLTLPLCPNPLIVTTIGNPLDLSGIDLSGLDVGTSKEDLVVTGPLELPCTSGSSALPAMYTLSRYILLLFLLLLVLLLLPIHFSPPIFTCDCPSEPPPPLQMPQATMDALSCGLGAC